MSVGCIKRLQTELKNFRTNPSTNVEACPSEESILKWYYIIDGPMDSPYEGGEYYGIVSFDKDYPFKAPHINMMTPNGRFETNSNICMSMTAWHQEMWQPSWQTATILQGLASFMAEEESAVATIKKTKPQRQELAKKSREWNLKNFKSFETLFPGRYEKAKKYVANGGKLDEEENKNSSKAASSTKIIDTSSIKNPQVKEAIEIANKAQIEKEEKARAAAAAATAATTAPRVVESGQRRGRESETTSTSFSSQQQAKPKAPSNSAAAAQEVIELD